MAKRNPGAVIAELHSIRTQITEQGKVVDALKAKRDTIELELLALLKEQGVVRTATQTHTASITEDVVASVVDWDAFYKYMARENKLYMLQRRPSNTAYRDELDAREGKPIPGVESFTKRGISLRKN